MIGENNNEAEVAPVGASDRIKSLDVLRGFALLGILLLNILGFGLFSGAYSNPGFDLDQTTKLGLIVWASVELFAEGAMRCLFSMLFGAGVVLFAGRGKDRSMSLHYRRTFWLLLFGLINAYVLLWSGDILVTYALAGALLYWLRNVRAYWLMTWAIALLILLSAFNWAMGLGLGMSKEAYEKVSNAAATEEIDEQTQEMAKGWEDFLKDYQPVGNEIEEELLARRTSYATAFTWNAEHLGPILLFVLPMFFLPDALVMMLFGMALYKARVLQGERSRVTYLIMAALGITVGVAINGLEVSRAYSSGFDILATFAFFQPTYHLGRLALAIGYIGILCLIVKSGAWVWLIDRLASVGRMALTNYLMQSFICMILFTGAGFALVGHLTRPMLYPIVLGIWIFQIIFSHYWLSRFRQGPLERLWRTLTYGRAARPRSQAGENRNSR